MLLHDLDTPALFVDLDQMMKNIKTMQAHLSKNGIKNRPHIKTHKIPAIAYLQIREGAEGITCQKISEAEIMAHAGIRDILLSFNIVGEYKLERLIRLAKQVNLQLIADSREVLQGLSSVFAREGLRVKILVECDIAVMRSGVRSPTDAVSIVEEIERLPGLEYHGLMQFKGGYPDIEFIKRTGWFFNEALHLLKKKGIETKVVSSGGTVYANTGWPTYAKEISMVTECRPGAYVFYDMIKVAQGVATIDQCSAKVIATVVSKPGKDRVIIDAGSKAIGIRRGYSEIDLGRHGYIVEYPEAVLSNLYEEHGIIDGCPGEVRIGDKLTIIPNYIMDNIHFHDTLYGVRKGTVETIWPIAARGKMQ